METLTAIFSNAAWAASWVATVGAVVAPVAAAYLFYPRQMKAENETDNVPGLKAVAAVPSFDGSVAVPAAAAEQDTGKGKKAPPSVPVAAP